jgi:RHS repeat-associated protein
VFFDNFTVQYKQGPVLEENHYYPGGLTMAGISDKALKTSYAENKYRWNKGSELQNKEFSDGSGLELYETFYRSLDPQLGRFWQIDPLVLKYPEWSPYVYGIDNPIRFNDPDGKDFVDQKGKHVAVTFNKDGTVKLGKNANADLVRLTTGMAKTEIGRTILHTMNDSKTHISMQIDNEHVIYNKDGSVRGGVTEPTVSQQTVNGQPVGEKYISSAKITIYEAAIQKMSDDHDGKQSINGVTFDAKAGSITMEDIIASFGVHEGTHATDRGSSSSLNSKATTEQVEKKPYANQILFLQQVQQQANQTNSNANN